MASDVTPLRDMTGWGRDRRSASPRCMGCVTHVKCETQQDAERMAHRLAEALEKFDYTSRREALEAYDRWK